MTTEIDALKTSEFIRRRKLRLQQVREQSKDIAKKIRQRAKVERLRQVVELDANKQKKYFQRQEQLVKQLEDFYAKGIENVGVSHQKASDVKLQENQTRRVDASKQRGKEAAAELRRKRQEKLDEQKKLLDRKLQAREAANEVSREKSATVLNKLTKSSNKDLEGQSKDSVPDSNKQAISGGDGSEVKCNDMATQWDPEPNEWEPNIPKLSLPNDDKDKESNNNIESKSDKSRRLDLFALSEEMPSSLRGGLTTQEERAPVKPSLTLVTEYLKSRGLRLREADTTESSKKKNMDELHSLKQTIQRTRAPKEGTGCVCQVHDEELVPVPTWRAEINCGFCTHSISHHRQFKHTRTCSSLHVNNLFGPVKPLQPDLLPSPVLRGTTPFRRNRIPLRSFSAKGNADKGSKPIAVNSATPKKSSVTMYNHSTRIERDIPYNDEKLVVRDLQIDDDAYSQAMKESSTDNKEKDHQTKIQEVRSKVAMKKQNVEKEYRDTISFLNSLPKDMTNKPLRRAYMDEDRQQSMRDCRQQKLQQEYKKIIKECEKHNCKNKTKSKSKSPSKSNDFDSTDFQYSWMPVPESDGNLAIHAIPTSLKEGKSGNTVKFSQVDSYHEYRSRHKHTPPTKDTNQQPKPFVEAVLMQSSSDSESVSSEASSAENIQLEKKNKPKETERLSDAERIIIYKILDSKNEKTKNSKIIKDIAKSLTFIEKQNTKRRSKSHSKQSKAKKISSDSDKRISLEELNEGVYKAVNENGTGDNIASMYFDKGEDKIELTEDELKYGRPCCCSKTLSKDQQREKGTTSLQWESGDNPSQDSRPTNSCSECKCGCKNPFQPKLHVFEESTDQQSARQPSAATSTSSFKTATNDKANNALPDGGYIKLIDEGGEEAGKFYIGASGFLKDDAYEVVIQLRKKGDDKEVRKIPTELPKINEEDLVNTESVSTESTKFTGPLKTAEDINTDKSITNEFNELNNTKKNNKTQDIVVNVASEVPVNKVVKQSSIKSDQDINIQYKNLKDVSEKGVTTSFRDSFAIPIHVPKSDSNPRPATSTYTQTSMSSPNNRPVFFHMSSSTSTAYMSPPEMILPKFLRQDHRMLDDDLYDSRNFEMQDKIEVTDEHEYCEDYECKCRRCRHARKVTLCRTNTHRCKKVNHRTGRAKAPPNTARSGQEDFDDVVMSSNSRENCQCRKCRSRNGLEKPTSSCSHLNKNKRITTTKHSFKNLVPRVTTSSALTNKVGQKRRNKPNLNPIIRDYVNKLLALNKESLVAVQVVDQDCSSVATPGSSIINVLNNNNNKKPEIENKISLEQIKTMLKQQILDECKKETSNASNYSDVCLKDVSNNNQKFKVPRKKTIHKVKSLNISKHLFKNKKTFQNKPPQPKQMSSSSSITKEHLKIPPLPSKSKIRSKSSPTPRLAPANPDVIRSKTCTNVAPNISKESGNLCAKSSKTMEHNRELQRNTEVLPCHRATTISTSPNSEISAARRKGNNYETPSNMSTQTSSEVNFLKFDEDKIQNMEKIADLTEKCTKRLSNLAKVLEEVRRNKSLAYSQISTSDTASDSDQKSDKSTNKMPANVYQSFQDTQKTLESKTPDNFAPMEKRNENENHTDSFVPFLDDIPKPDSLKSPTFELNFSSNSSNKSNPSSPVSNHLKSRGKPPPALSRIHIKHVQDYLIPHELSTVVEVDSPMSVKLKSQSSRNETRLEVPDSFNRIDSTTYKTDHKNDERNNANPDSLVSKVDIPGQTKILATESSDDSKVQMIDMNQFNEIMLKPFFSLQEYAKHHNVGALDDGSNLEDFARGDIINDEFSSLHSDGSLPDVISELLKRNIISEPFKFDTQSNVNSTTISSESTLSVLALSKVRKDKKKSSVMFQNKENIGETSDTLSISSNPDLENAFKMLGMGWASSTLKKTKERLALSSSSNTSSSSLSQFKIKSFNQDVPVLVTDTVSSVLNLSNKKQQKPNAPDISKNAEQQTSLTNSMTVKEFLTNELAKKITFTNKSRNDTEEFVSLFETKMPEEMKHTSRMVREDSVDNSLRSANRARTSTPVQLFKSMTYQSSSSSNISNGLFSNADDLSSVKQTSNSMKHSTSDKDDLTIPNFSLRINKGSSDCSKSD